ncbi:unnamed protein product [Protopolystoma xenopodis]|uniref:Uncharacterized protein n=1 Tax=Protopolystoma xenopodis TaxID=117903 RepID=A0A3S5AM06_9PLAT|nr:unnamed protein product [Protopolystoma xenopodis]
MPNRPSSFFRLPQSVEAEERQVRLRLLRWRADLVTWPRSALEHLAETLVYKEFQACTGGRWADTFKIHIKAPRGTASLPDEDTSSQQ